MTDSSDLRNAQLAGDFGRAIGERRQALDQVGYCGHAEMTQSALSGNALAERMSHRYLDHTGDSAFAKMSKTLACVLRHGLSAADVREIASGSCVPTTL